MFLFTELFSYTNPSSYPVISNESPYSILELSNVSFEDEMVEICLLMVSRGSFNTHSRWLDIYDIDWVISHPPQVFVF